MNGSHGRIVQQHVAKESKQELEHVPMMLQTSASHSMSKEAALCLRLIGNHGRIAQQLAVMVFKQEQEHVHTIKEVPSMIQKVTRKLVISKNVVSD